MELKNQIINALNWRYATKQFNADKKLTEDQLELLLEAVQLSPSSYGLQPYKVLVISNQKVKAELKAAAYGQTQLTDASHIIVFARTKTYTTAEVDKFAENIAQTRSIEVSMIKDYVDMMKGTVSSRSQEELANWNARQAYIALGVLLETAALNEIDACPMEGFDSAQFDAILGLDELNLSSVVIAPIGFRADEDVYQHFKKVRKSKDDLFIHI